MTDFLFIHLFIYLFFAHFFVRFLSEGRFSPLRFKKNKIKNMQLQFWFADS